MAKFNYRQIKQSIATSPAGEKRVQTVINKKFEASKAVLLEEFESDPVTKEIRSGGNNISDTLGGKGDLRSFIGFDAGANPADDLKDVLQQEVVLAKSVKRQDGTAAFTFSVRIPNESIKSATPLPWENGQSWAEGIEKGISGFGNYLRGVFDSPDPSRSGKGVQVKQTVRGGSFRPRPYLSKMFKDFINRIK